MISIKYLPNFLANLYQSSFSQGNGLSKEILVANLANLCKKTLEFLTQLAFLECSQTNCFAPNLLSKILTYSGTNLKETHELLRLFLNSLQEKQIISVLPWSNLREKYPSLKKETEDRLTNLLIFNELSHFLPAAISSNDISDTIELVESLFADLSFLEEASKISEGNKLVYKNKVLILSPWFQCYNGQWTETEDQSFAAGCKEWFPNIWKQYQNKEIENFNSYCEPYQKEYTIAPWLETRLYQLIQDGFWEIQYRKQTSHILIEGYPATGKTALAANLGKIIVPHLADMVESYFLYDESLCPSSTKILTWLANISKNIFPEKKAAIIIDGIEYLSSEELYNLLQKIKQESSYQRLLFILFQRKQEKHSIATYKKIDLSPEDNVFFEQSFTKNYIASLLRQYVGNSTLSKQIFITLSQNQKPWSVRQLAQEFNLFTPKVLQKLLEMKPLLERTFSTHAGYQYTLFHNVCRKFVK